MSLLAVRCSVLPAVARLRFRFSDLYTVGGSLGWKSRGDLDPTFADAAFEIETSSTGNPKYGEVKTGFGYHIFMVEGRK